MVIIHPKAEDNLLKDDNIQQHDDYSNISNDNANNDGDIIDNNNDKNDVSIMLLI
mgnify:CR=1 FL=1